MPLQEQVIPVDFGGGVDTKTDPKLVMPGKFLSVQNGVFTSPKRVTKRNGYTAVSTDIAGGGSLVSPQFLRGYKKEMVCSDQGTFYSFSETDDAWISKGKYKSIDVAKTSIDQTATTTGFVDMATLGNYQLSVWSSYNNSPKSDNLNIDKTSAYFKVVDLQTNAVLSVTGGSNLLHAESNQSTDGLAAKCIVLGGTTLAIFYYNDATNFYVIRTLTLPGDGTVTLSAETNIVSPGAMVSVNFDVAATSTGGIFAGYVSGGIKVYKFNSTGTSTANASLVIAGLNANNATIPIFVSASSFNGYFWVYFTKTLTYHYFVLDSALATILAPTLIYTSPALAASVFFGLNIMAVDKDSANQTFYYGYYTQPIATVLTSNDITQTTLATVSNAGVVTTGATVNNIVPYSKAITVGSNQYAVFLYIGSLALGVSAQYQATFFLVDISSFSVLSRFAYGLANLTQYIPIFTGRGGIGYNPDLTLISSKLYFPCSILTQELPLNLFAGGSAGPFAGISGAFLYSFDFSGANIYSSAITNDTLILGGGLLKMYDGKQCVELGFHVAPEINAMGQVTPGGSIAAGDYSYLAIFQWIDDLGNLHQSATSIPQSITVAAGSSKVQLLVLSPVLTDKQNVSVALYRTEKNGTVYYEITSPTKRTTFTGTEAFIEFEDSTSDANLVNALQAYTYPSSAVLENDTPQPASILVAHNNRLWFIDSENPNTAYYTKTGLPLVGVSPSGFLSLQLDSKYGNISALAEMDDKIVFFKENGLFVVSGDGSNDTGTGSTLSTPQPVPSDVGCSSFKSCITTPTGVMFQSSKGIYMIGRSLGVVYIGMDVERFNSQTYVAATLIDGKSQIRFLTSSGTSLVYDYIFNKWGEFTNHAGFSSDLWQGTYVYAKSDGKIFKESSTSYLDDATQFSLSLQTGWLALGSIQGFQRVRRLIMLGDYANGINTSHGMQIQIAYDFSTSYGTAIPFSFGAASSSGPFQYRERLPRQKCDAISLLITEDTSGNSSEYIDLTNISFEAGVKRGVNKLASSNSVG